MRISKRNAAAEKLPYTVFVESTKEPKRQRIQLLGKEQQTKQKMEQSFSLPLKDQKRPQNDHLENIQRKKITTYQVGKNLSKNISLQAKTFCAEQQHY